MPEENLIRKMNSKEQQAIINLDKLMDKAEKSGNLEDWEEFKLTLDDYLDQGYKSPVIKCYIFKYNSLVQKISKLS